jgi:hypothetical protein
MKKPLPGQQKCLFSLRKGEKTLKNPLAIPTFPMDAKGCPTAHSVFHLEWQATWEPVLLSDEEMGDSAKFIDVFIWLPAGHNLEPLGSELGAGVRRVIQACAGRQNGYDGHQ